MNVSFDDLRYGNLNIILSKEEIVEAYNIYRRFDEFFLSKQKDICKDEEPVD